MDAPAGGHSVHCSAARHGADDPLRSRPEYASLQYSYASTDGTDVANPVVGRFRRVGQSSTLSEKQIEFRVDSKS